MDNQFLKLKKTVISSVGDTLQTELKPYSEAQEVGAQSSGCILLVGSEYSEIFCVGRGCYCSFILNWSVKRSISTAIYSCNRNILTFSSLFETTGVGSLLNLCGPEMAYSSRHKISFLWPYCTSNHILHVLLVIV